MYENFVADIPSAKNIGWNDYCMVFNNTTKEWW